MEKEKDEKVDDDENKNDTKDIIKYIFFSIDKLAKENQSSKPSIDIKENVKEKENQKENEKENKKEKEKQNEKGKKREIRSTLDNTSIEQIKKSLLIQFNSFSPENIFLNDLLTKKDKNDFRFEKFLQDCLNANFNATLGTISTSTSTSTWYKEFHGLKKDGMVENDKIIININFENDREKIALYFMRNLNSKNYFVNKVQNTSSKDTNTFSTSSTDINSSETFSTSSTKTFSTSSSKNSSNITSIDKYSETTSKNSKLDSSIKSSKKSSSKSSSKNSKNVNDSSNKDYSVGDTDDNSNNNVDSDSDSSSNGDSDTDSDNTVGVTPSKSKFGINSDSEIEIKESGSKELEEIRHYKK
ncbi:hypothetical protein ACTFIZ_006713 [Dictyostelium cf. discoideum]